MKIFQFPSDQAEKKVQDIINRGLGFSAEDHERVEQILKDVQKRGDAALVDYTCRFDSKNISENSLKVSRSEFEQAAGQVEQDFLDALETAACQVESFHKKQRQNSWIDTPKNGVMVGQLIRPVDAAGIYVPGAKGGMTPLVSSVLMGAIPAKVAGVSSINLMTPPMENGQISPYILAAAKRVGVDNIFKSGSAWAIGALAYGTETVPKVDVIVGPGNIYVTLAKKIVSGHTGIDMIAGPSEILIVADKNANPAFIAADLLSQAEHDAMASSILITDSSELARNAVKEIEKQLETLSRKETAEQSLKNFGAIITVEDIETGIALANRFAPEHLELMIEDSFEYLDLVKNAGAVFLGDYTPEPVGDYIAGPNHVLPTAGTARFSSALSVDNFIKKTSLIHYSKKAFEKEAGQIIRLAETEGLGAHANSVRIRKNQ